MIAAGPWQVALSRHLALGTSWQKGRDRPLTIKAPEAERLARPVARLTGDTLTQTVAALPTLDQREDEAIPGYDRMTP